MDVNEREVRMTPSAPDWELVHADDLSACWLEYAVHQQLYVCVEMLRDEDGYVAVLINSAIDAYYLSPIIAIQDDAKEVAIAMLEQYLCDIAAECMRLAGAE